LKWGLAAAVLGVLAILLLYWRRHAVRPKQA
jgi:hypothetical protein